jgi:hypothetical protein
LFALHAMTFGLESSWLDSSSSEPALIIIPDYSEIVNDAARWILEKKKELLSEQGQPIEQPPEDYEQEQQEEQEPETFNKTF